MPVYPGALASLRGPILRPGPPQCKPKKNRRSRKHRLWKTVAESPSPRYNRSCPGSGPLAGFEVDRKSTRLNSSHRCISYAVFCLKKKKKKKIKKNKIKEDKTERI